MGLAASQFRLLMLTARKSDLEFQVQTICQDRTVASAQVQGLSMAFSSGMMAIQEQMAALTPGTEGFDEAYDALSAKMDALSQLQECMTLSVQSKDKQLEVQQKVYETQHTEVQTEIESVQKVLNKNIESSFKYMQA